MLRRTCKDFARLNRRQMLAGCGASVLGLSLPGVLALRSQAATQSPSTGFGQAKSCIVLFCWGGVSHIDTWDPKPNAPAEVRGEFKPIATADARDLRRRAHAAAGPANAPAGRHALDPPSLRGPRQGDVLEHDRPSAARSREVAGQLAALGAATGPTSARGGEAAAPAARPARCGPDPVPAGGQQHPAGRRRSGLARPSPCSDHPSAQPRPALRRRLARPRQPGPDAGPGRGRCPLPGPVDSRRSWRDRRPTSQPSVVFSTSRTWPSISCSVPSVRATLDLDREDPRVRESTAITSVRHQRAPGAAIG